MASSTLVKGRFRDMRPDVVEFLLGARRRRMMVTTKKKTMRSEEKAEERCERVRYDCAFEDEEGKRGRFSRLVWAKVRGHPWWPGQVFDPAEASVAAQLERRRRGAVLVAFFGDNSFAWVADDAAELCPFRAGFARHARDVPVVSAVDPALAEVARRVYAGLSCGCTTVTTNSSSDEVVEKNAGVREGASSMVDAAYTRDAFRGAAFVEYVSALALAPLAGADMLDLAIATAQLKAFTRWRGSARGLPEYTASYGIIEDIVMEPTPLRRASAKKGRSNDADAVKRKVSRCKAKAASGSVDDDDDAIEEIEEFKPPPAQPPTHQMTTKMGKLMRQAVQQMSQSSPVIRKPGRDAPPQVVVPVSVPDHSLTKCTTRGADHTTPPVELHNGAPLLPGLVLNFTGPSVVPPASELVNIFRQFGPIKETRTENSAFVVIFNRAVDAETAFSVTANISSLSPKLTGFRLAYSLLPAADPQHRNINTPEKDQTPVEVEVEDGYGCDLNTDGMDWVPVEVKVCHGL